MFLSILVAAATGLSPLPTQQLSIESPAAACQPMATSDTAVTRVYTPANEAWFSELIDLNPSATIVVRGQGIAVSRSGGLTLPAGPLPPTVTLS
ncbi:MAG: hypothetical protein AB8H80_02840 [Planctomycetota bacterium]